MDTEFVAGPMVQTIFVLQLVFIVSHHYTASDSWCALLTNGLSVLNNLHQLRNPDCIWEKVAKRGPARSEIMCETIKWSRVFGLGGQSGAGWLVQENLTGSKLQAVST